ncbi:hypothetical protein HK098_002139, partial [Nowakowskiella sp. JEL0407]
MEIDTLGLSRTTKVSDFRTQNKTPISIIQQTQQTDTPDRSTIKEEYNVWKTPSLLSIRTPKTGDNAVSNSTPISHLKRELSSISRLRGEFKLPGSNDSISKASDSESQSSSKDKENDLPPESLPLKPAKLQRFHSAGDIEQNKRTEQKESTAEPYSFKLDKHNISKFRTSATKLGSTGLLKRSWEPQQSSSSSLLTSIKKSEDNSELKQTPQKIPTASAIETPILNRTGTEEGVKLGAQKLETKSRTNSVLAEFANQYSTPQREIKEPSPVPAASTASLELASGRSHPQPRQQQPKEEQKAQQPPASKPPLQPILKPSRPVIEPQEPIEYESEPITKEFFTVKTRKYQKLSLIGRGGSSKVYKVLSQDTFEIYALKKVKIDGGVDKCIVEGYINEIELLTQLLKEDEDDQGESSKWIVKLVDSFIDIRKGVVWMVLEFGEIDLNSILVREK